MNKLTDFQLIVIGCSAGGIEVLKNILSQIRSPQLPPIVIVQHRAAERPAVMIPFFQQICPLPVREAESKEPLQRGHIYFAPAGYHLLVAEEMHFELTVEEPVNYSRPSIDVLFESTADIPGCKVLGVVLTGANNDGAEGLKKIVQAGGVALVQTPEEAAFPQMPEAALQAVPGAKRLNVNEIVRFLVEMNPA